MLYTLLYTNLIVFMKIPTFDIAKATFVDNLNDLIQNNSNCDDREPDHELIKKKSLDLHSYLLEFAKKSSVLESRILAASVLEMLDLAKRNIHHLEEELLLISLRTVVSGFHDLAEKAIKDQKYVRELAILNRRLILQKQQSNAAPIGASHAQKTDINIPKHSENFVYDIDENIKCTNISHLARILDDLVKLDKENYIMGKYFNRNRFREAVAVALNLPVNQVSSLITSNPGGTLKNDKNDRVMDAEFLKYILTQKKVI